MRISGPMIDGGLMGLKPGAEKTGEVWTNSPGHPILHFREGGVLIMLGSL